MKATVFGENFHGITFSIHLDCYIYRPHIPLHHHALQSRIFSPVEKIFHTNVPIMYNATETLNTSFQEPAMKNHI